MRNLLLVILISASSVWASDSYSQNTQLKLSATEGTIESIFNQISKQSRLEFFYNTNILNAKEKVSLSIKQGTLDEILKEILGERYSYTIKDRYILITKNKTESAEQNEVVVVKGVVRDMKGNVLPGVSVVLKGTTIGVSTDANGEFSLKIPAQENINLVFSFIGMKNKEITWNGQALLKVDMEEDVAEMEEVVVTGYQEIKKTRMTGAVEVVTAKDIANKGFTSIEDERDIGRRDYHEHHGPSGSTSSDSYPGNQFVDRKYRPDLDYRRNAVTGRSARGRAGSFRFTKYRFNQWYR